MQVRQPTAQGNRKVDSKYEPLPKGELNHAAPQW
jgi:hypothetical protein